MKTFNYIILFLIPAITNCFGQNNAIEDLRRGANILARQYYGQKELHKAKTLTKFVTIIDDKNPDNKLLISTILENKEIRVYHRLEDDGLAYSEFLMDLLKVLPDNAQTREKRIYGLYICSVINPVGPAVKMLPKDMDFSKFYSDIFEGDEPTPPVIKKLKADIAAKETMIETLNYNPTELLEAINTINYNLRLTGSQINIATEQIKVNLIDSENGYNIIDGPTLKASDKNVLFKNISVLEFLKYIEHTTIFSFQFEGHSINIIDGSNGENGRPKFFKNRKLISEEIQDSIIKSRSKFDNQNIQVKGLITQIKDAGTTFLLEIDDLFVVVVNKKNLKDKSIAIISEKFTEYDAAKKDSILKTMSRIQPYLEIVVRGKCKISRANQIYINDCDSILAENLGFFYTK